MQRSPEWLAAVFDRTHDARAARACVHEAIAQSEPSRHTTRAKWHWGRSRGQRERPSRVAKCGTERVVIVCKTCGQTHGQERDSRCGGWRYCSTCRGERAGRYTKRINEATDRWGFTKRREERSRFLTLTIPHSGDPKQDARVIMDAWQRFTRALRRWLRGPKPAKGSRDPLAFVRALELTTSDGGHAHLHAWIGSRYLPHAVLRVLWGRALTGAVYVPVRLLSEVLAETRDPRARAELVRVAGLRWRPGCEACPSEYELDGKQHKAMHYVPWPVLDVRAVPDGYVGRELAKYLVKDELFGEAADPERVGDCIEASEGLRTLAASLKFWLKKQRELCDCGATNLGLLRIESARAVQPRATSPPLS